MKKAQMGRLLVRYLAFRSRVLLGVFLGFGIFGTVHFLYRLPAEPFWYGAVLCLLVLILVFPVDFWLYQKKYRQLLAVTENLPLMLDSLPKADSLSEEQLAEIIQKMGRLLDEEHTKQLTRQSEAVDYYTTWVHQIKTPISVMKLALDGEDTEQSRQLSIELFRIEQYVEMALSYLRLDSESSDYLFREYELEPIIRQSVRKYAPQFIAKRLKLVVEPTDACAVTDEKWLSFLLEQLLSNSIKYTPSGSVTIRVTPEKILVVEDTGIGIAPEDLPRVFEKGFTGYNGREDKKATGLGLYLCKKTAQKLGHSIRIESQPGKGTRVLVGLAQSRSIME